MRKRRSLYFSSIDGASFYAGYVHWQLIAVILHPNRHLMKVQWMKEMEILVDQSLFSPIIDRWRYFLCNLSKLQLIADVIPHNKDITWKSSEWNKCCFFCFVLEIISQHNNKLNYAITLLMQWKIIAQAIKYENVDNDLL